MRNVLRDGIASHLMVTLTSGIFLVSFALDLGASNTVIGVLAALPAFAQLLQLPAIFVVERYRSPKRIVFTATLLSRLALPFIAAIPFLFSVRSGLVALVAGLAVHAGFGAVAGCAWNSWMRDLVPDGIRGAFFAERMRLSLLVGIPVSIAGGVFLDYWGVWAPSTPLLGYSILFALGAIAGFIGLYFVWNIEDVPLRADLTSTVVERIWKPFGDGNFRTFIGFTATWSFAVNLAAPFFTVFMLEKLGIGLGTVVVLFVLSQACHLLSLPLWGAIADRSGHRAVLSVSGTLLIFAILGWTFLTFPDVHAFTFALLAFLHVIMGAATAGVVLASGTLSAKLAPKNNATGYLAGHSVITALGAGTAPLLGGWLADYFVDKQLQLEWLTAETVMELPAVSLEHWDFLFLIAFVVGLYSLYRLAAVQEEGGSSHATVAAELRNEIARRARNYSSIGGLAGAFTFPVGRMSSDEDLNDES